MLPSTTITTSCIASTHIEGTSGKVRACFCCMHSMICGFPSFSLSLPPFYFLLYPLHHLLPSSCLHLFLLYIVLFPVPIPSSCICDVRVWSETGSGVLWTTVLAKTGMWPLWLSSLSSLSFSSSHPPPSSPILPPVLPPRCRLTATVCASWHCTSRTPSMLGYCGQCKR